MTDMFGQTPLLRMEGITKSFGGVPVLKGVGLTLDHGRALGLVGGNGSGKSTTMNILGGVIARDSGMMEIESQPYDPAGAHDARRAGIAFIHQELNLFPNLSIAENLSLEHYPFRAKLPGFIDWRRVRGRAGEVLTAVGLDLSPDTLVSALAPGEQQLVEVAKALLTNPRLIIFDEPTTSLTSREIQRLFAIIADLKARGIGVIYISHALQDVRTICDDVVILQDGMLADRGSVEEMSIDRIVAGMVGRHLEQVFPHRAPAAAQGAPRLSVRGLTKAGFVRDVSFDLHPGEILGLGGLMGSGRSELVRMIFGLDGYDSGTVTVGGDILPPGDPLLSIRRGLALLTEDRRVEGLLLKKSIGWNISLPNLVKSGRALSRLDTRRMDARARAQSARLNIKAPGIHVAAATLSGGNQQKVVVAKWLDVSPSVLILDEPTRGIDIGSKVEIYNLINTLAQDGMAVLLISSENEELLGLSDRILILARGELVETMSRGERGFDDAGVMRAMVRQG